MINLITFKMDFSFKHHFRKDVFAGVIVAAVVTYSCKKYLNSRSEKTAWLKYLKRVKNQLKPMFEFDNNSQEITKYGLVSSADAWVKENPRMLDYDENAIDSINVWGADTDGNTLMLRVARRHHRIAEVWIYLRLANGDEYQAPVQPDLKVNNTHGQHFNVKGLYFEVLEPLRRMRIGFNGILRKGVRNQWNAEEGETADVKFTFIWHPIYNYSTYPFDFNPILMASSFSNKKWTNELAKRFSISPVEWHEQWGQLHGPVTVNRDDYTLMLTGTKTREYGVLNWNTIDRRLVIKGMDSIATGFTLYGKYNEECSIRTYHGQVAPPSGMELLSVSECQIKKAERFFDIDGVSSERIKIDLVAGHRHYNISVATNGHGFHFYAGENWNIRGSCRLVKTKVNGIFGFALVETYEEFVFDCPINRLPSVHLLMEPDLRQTESLIVLFNDYDCQNRRLVGSKGASVALMSIMNSHNAMVPKGFCLTKTCLERHLEEQPHYAALIGQIKRLARSGLTSDLQRECDSLQVTACRIPIFSHLNTELMRLLENLFGKEYKTLRYAVRSSVIVSEENYTEASKAGLNESHLGITGYKMILDAIRKCWASQFSFEAVQLRKKYCQLLDVSMGIIIQEMVPASAAGLLTSRYQDVGNAAQMLLYSNYGLGKSLTSTELVPDYFVLRRSWGDVLSIPEKFCGTKKFRIDMDETTGVEKVDNDINTVGEFSISNELALKIAEVYVEIEKHLGGAREMEWAVVKNELYILHATPVIKYMMLTDFEVQHEFDTPIRSLSECSTTGNVAEIVQGALSPLSLTSHVRALCISFQLGLTPRANYRFDPSVFFGTVHHTNHVFYDVIHNAALVTDKRRSVEFSVFGSIADETNLLEMASARFEKSPTWKTPSYMDVLTIEKLVSSMKKLLKDCQLNMVGVDAPQEVYDRIAEHLLKINEMFTMHVKVTAASFYWKNLALEMLSAENYCIIDKDYADFAALIGSGIGTESGNVPRSLKEIVTAIEEDFGASVFGALTPKEADEQLKNKSLNSSKQFTSFIENYGHRGMKEFDIMYDTWCTNRLAIIEALLLMVKRTIVLRGGNKTSTWNVLRKRKPNMGHFRRLILFFVLNRCKKAMCSREKSMSILVKFINGLRLAFRQLATLMVEQNFVLKKESVYFMTLEEIDQLLKTRSTHIIMRMNRREELFEKMNALKYPEFVRGIPTPLAETASATSRITVLERSGITVVDEEVKGIVRVITLNDLGSIQEDDIIVTHAIDICLVPYFLVIKGIVAEAGGFGSHGAVFTRDSGVPCIIGVKNATKLFKTGDKVRMHAVLGMVQKVR